MGSSLSIEGPDLVLEAAAEAALDVDREGDERFREWCVAPADKFAYQRCREAWPAFTPWIRRPNFGLRDLRLILQEDCG